jgi:dTMP kinase
VVLLDRFFLSTYAYQGAGRGLPDGEIAAANRLATHGLVPDVTLLLTLPPAEGLARAAQRGAHDRMERAEAAFHERVSAAFARFASSAWQAEHPECGPIAVIDARGSEREVTARVRAEWGRRWPASFQRR